MDQVWYVIESREGPGLAYSNESKWDLVRIYYDLVIGRLETHVLFDTGAPHSFFSPGSIEKGLFQMGTGDDGPVGK